MEDCKNHLKKNRSYMIAS